jgi:hypothetical protein
MGRPSPSTLFVLLLALMGPFAADGQLSAAADIVKFCKSLDCAKIDSFSIMRHSTCSLITLTFGFPNY